MKTAIKRYREGKNLPGKGKSDEVDALAIAAYPLDPENWHPNGRVNALKFLIVQTRAIAKVRQRCQELNHLARIETPMVNYFRQRLAWEFPEVAHRNLKSQTNFSPPLLGCLADKRECTSAVGWTRIENEYQNSIAPN